MTTETTPRKRAIVFIDGNNLHRGLKACFWIERLHLEPFCQQLVVPHQLTKIYYADSDYIKERGEEAFSQQQAYFSDVRKIGDILEFRRGFYPKDRWKDEKRVDVHLATDLVDLAHLNAYDVAYLVSGDTDLEPAVAAAKRVGKTVINAYLDEKFERDGKVIERKSYLRYPCGNFVRITHSMASKYAWVYTPPVDILLDEKGKPAPVESAGDDASQ